MKYTTIFSAGILAAFTWGASAYAANPPLDCPSPPPCCADGVCYPNPLTYGYYPTRWRNWPCACLEPIPSHMPTTPSGKPIPDLKPYETPTPEDEDRRAPPPTKKPTPEGQAPAHGEQANPNAPVNQPSGVPTQPSTNELPPWEQVPTPGPGTPAPGTTTSPTGDDPPPAPPIAGSPAKRQPVAQPTTRPKAAPTRTATRQPQLSTTGDPPPSLPLAVSGGH